MTRSRNIEINKSQDSNLSRDSNQLDKLISHDDARWR